MPIVLRLILTLVSAVLGVFAAKKLKLPVPFMLGAMLGVAVFNIFSGEAWFPREIKTYTQSISGAYIGLSLTRRDIKNIKQLIAPTLVMLFGFLVFTTGVGLILFKVFGLDMATSFLVAIPGGVTEISLMAYDVGADPAIVSFLQTFRVFAVYLIFPAMITKTRERVGIEETEALEGEADGPKREYFIDRFIPDNDVLRQLMTAVIGIIGGLIGKATGLPAGTLSFAMIMVIIVHINSNKLHLERKYKRYVQVLSGTLIGLSISMDTVHSFGKIVAPALSLIFFYVAANYIISWFMAKTKKIDFISSMFASAPGAASDMALIASDIGGDSPKIALLQIIRLVACYSIYPMWTKLLMGWLA
ncbi:MAG: AbrB family transcriptional regulator [Firmicutes bacterium]|nr:AbrB family transcriptional regulator [Bacillota bacterium]